jgi:MauM/NapG family ferredoxin protein
MRARTLRAAVQGLFFCFFVLLFALTVFPLRSRIPVDLLLRADPLIAAVSFLASRTVVSRMLLSVVLLIATLVLGRFFCGYICPLGTIVDLADRPLSCSKLARLKLQIVPRTIKFYLLGLLLFMALFGHSLIWPLDPLVIFARSLTAVFHPAAVFLSNLGLDLFRPLAERWELDALANAGFDEPSYVFWLVPIVILIFPLGLSLLGSRFWCRAICPLGALLALVARLSPVKRVVRNDLCTHCHLCRKKCPMSCIGEDELETALGECIECRSCVVICPHRAVSFRLGSPRPRAKVHWDRRRFIVSFLLGMGAFSLTRILPRTGWAEARRIRPPGAVPEAFFQTRCLRCGQCMKVCLTNGLQPATDEAGAVGVWTPVLVPRKGGCERHCNMCGQVCPTQAIRALSLEEKSYARLGCAHVQQARCLEWGQGKACLVCDEVCPYGAISVGRKEIEGQARRGPVVDAEVCVGCGICEHHCPVLGEAAIRVAMAGEDRRLDGSYITVQKARARQRALQGESPREG